jgi:hypothetical protein
MHVSKDNVAQFSEALGDTAKTEADGCVFMLGETVSYSAQHMLDDTKQRSLDATISEGIMFNVGFEHG